MKKILVFMLIAIILVGTIGMGKDLVIKKQIHDIESYVVQNGLDVSHVSYDDNTFHIEIKVKSYEDEIVTDIEKKGDLLIGVGTDAIYFNSKITLSFLVV